MNPQKLEELHAELVATLAKPGRAICRSLSTEKAELLHGAIGVCTEAGEVLDAVKKFVIHESDLDTVIENVIEELGDLEFYMRAVRRNLGISRDETLEGNIEKLNRRYASGTYSDEQAKARADKEDI